MEEKRDSFRAGNATIQILPDNIIITFTDMKGETVAWSSSLTQGFEGRWKVMPIAARKAADVATQKAMDIGMTDVDVYVKDESGTADMTDTIRAAIDTILASDMKVEIVKHRYQTRTDEERTTVGKEVFMLEEYIKRVREWLKSL